MTNPCKDCEYRNIGCHAKCQVYASWSEENETIKQNKQKYSWQAKNFLMDSALRTMRRRNKER